MQIWKYQLQPESMRVPHGGFGAVTEVSMPEGADILQLQVQHGIPTFWALVKEDAPKEKRRFMVFGTGHVMPDDLRLGNGKYSYVGTFQIDDGRLVYHVFEEHS